MKRTTPPIDWKKYFFELIVIVTGITLSFAVQNWQQDREHKQSEIRILERIHDDLAEDTLTLKQQAMIRYRKAYEEIAGLMGEIEAEINRLR